MKYLSLIGLMNIYGHMIKDGHRLIHLNYYDINNGFDQNNTYDPFNIYSVDHEGQEIKQITLDDRSHIEQRFNTERMPASFDMPPVLELEWLRTKLDLGEEVFGVLEQLSYFMVAHIMIQRSMQTEFGVITWMERLEAEEAIIEVEDLEDTAAILSNKELPVINMPKIRSWTVCFMYGIDFESILFYCKEQQNLFSELYYHLPILLSMFMVDYIGNGLEYWNKSTRLQVEKDMYEMMSRFNGFDIRDADIYTYGRCMAITTKDIALLNAVFNSIYDKLHKKNKKIGLISFYDYEKIQGPDVKQASVRLSNMHVRWKDEMERAEAESDSKDLSEEL